MDHSSPLLLSDDRFDEHSSKLEHRLDLTSNSSDFNDFATLHMHENVRYDVDGLTQLGDFRLDFQGFTESHFDKLPATCR